MRQQHSKWSSNTTLDKMQNTYSHYLILTVVTYSIPLTPSAQCVTQVALRRGSSHSEDRSTWKPKYIVYTVFKSRDDGCFRDFDKYDRQTAPCHGWSQVARIDGRSRFEEHFGEALEKHLTLDRQ